MRASTWLENAWRTHKRSLLDVWCFPALLPHKKTIKYTSRPIRHRPLTRRKALPSPVGTLKQKLLKAQYEGDVRQGLFITLYSFLEESLNATPNHFGWQWLWSYLYRRTGADLLTSESSFFPELLRGHVHSYLFSDTSDARNGNDCNHIRFCICRAGRSNMGGSHLDHVHNCQAKEGLRGLRFLARHLKATERPLGYSCAHRS